MLTEEAITTAQKRLATWEPQAGWSKVRLGELFSPVVDTGHQEGLPVLAVTMDRGVVRRDSLDRRFDREVNNEQYRKAKKGDIAYNTMRMWQGASGLVAEDGFVSPAYTICRPSSTESAEFWAHYFKSTVAIQQFRDHSQGVAKDRYRLYFEHFATVPVLRPPLSEQRKIAAILSSVDATIERTEAVIEQLRNVKKATVKELMTRGLPGLHTRFKRTEVGMIPETWAVCNLGSVANIGNGTTPSKSKKEYWNGGTIPWLPTGKVNDEIITNSSLFVTDQALKQTSIRLLPPGTLLMAMIGQGKTRGRVAYLAIEACVNQNFAYIVTGSAVNPWFLYTYLESQYEAIRSGGRGSNQDALNCSLVKAIPVPLPPLEEQLAIARTATGLRERLHAEEQLVVATTAVRAALMSVLLTGQLRVTPDEE